MLRCARNEVTLWMVVGIEQLATVIATTRNEVGSNLLYPNHQAKRTVIGGK
ncbi:MAG: hypothetical protein NTZ69_17880 [Bacteroidia bacterium]|nr:hypothetical protein [Bacteroidia bacterium]